MQVTVRFYAELARHYNGGTRQRTVDLPPDSSVDDLLAAVGIPDNLEYLIVGRNGDLARRSTSLADGDEIELMTQMEGGLAGRQ